MAPIGTYTPDELIADYPLDFGNGVRGDYITVDGAPVGILMVHELVNGTVCGGSIYWSRPQEEVVVPLWALGSFDPLTLNNSVRCSCGLHGHIREGKYTDETDSVRA